MTKLDYIFLVGAFLCALVISLAGAPVAEIIAYKIGAIDVPKDARRMHKKPIPRLGGIAIFAGFYISTIIFETRYMAKEIRGMLIGSIIIVALGMFDDVLALKPMQKFGFQVIATLIPTFCGVRITGIPNFFDPSAANFVLPLPLQYVVTVIWMLAILNAVNLLDGLDGLAAGVSAIMSICVTVIVVLLQSPAVAVVAAALAGACLGFMPYNFNPAKMFMGDTGSMFIGYTLAVMSVMGVFGVSVVGNRCVRLLNSALRKLPAVIKSFIGAIASSACAVICIAPISISAFGGISLLGALSTVVLSPVFAAALTVAVCFAVTGLGILIAPLGVLMNVAYYIIAFLGQFTGAWLSMDFNYAPVIAWLCATALTAALLIPRKLLSVGTFTAAAAAILNLTLCFFTANDRKMIDFISDGSSGAAVICNRSEATILICGDGARLGNKLSDCLLSHGIQSIELIAAYDLSAASCESLAEICALYPTDTISVSKPAATVLSAALHDTEITTEKIAHINANGVTIACAKTNDTECTADIVLYSGYKQTVPKHGGILPLYISSRQELLPRGGVNIYDTDFEIDLENYYG